jgi:hypothetical protein
MYRTTLITFLITRLQKNTEHNYDIDCDYVTLDVVRLMDKMLRQNIVVSWCLVLLSTSAPEFFLLALPTLPPRPHIQC